MAANKKIHLANVANQSWWRLFVNKIAGATTV